MLKQDYNQPQSFAKEVEETESQVDMDLNFDIDFTKELPLF